MSTSTPSSPLDSLIQLIQTQSSPSQKELLTPFLKGQLTQGTISETLLDMGKVLGRNQFLIRTFSQREHAAVDSIYGSCPVGHWMYIQAVKVVFLSQYVSQHKETQSPFKHLFEIYDLGDVETRIACLRALNFIEDDPKAGLELVYDAGRTYLSELMDAGWCNNPFSTEHLSTEEYRKAVLKSLFCDVDVGGFLKLEERADEELARSLCEYANEREAAGRSVPHSVWIVSARYPRPGLVARLIGRLEHPNEDERKVAILSLKSAQDQRAVSFLEDRLEREDSIECQKLIQDTLTSLSS